MPEVGEGGFARDHFAVMQLRCAGGATAECALSFSRCFRIITAFHPAAEKVLGSTAESIVELSQQSQKICEEALKDTYYDEMLELQLRAKLDTWGGEARTNVTCVGAQRISSREHSRMLLKEIHQLLK